MNVFVGKVERRGWSYVVKFGLYGVNFLNKEVIEFVSKSNFII